MINVKKKCLLHTCCAPCLTSANAKLADKHDATTFWYNPNIEPKEEHDKRYETFIQFINQTGIKNFNYKYDYSTENSLWHEHIQGLENEPEGGKRCAKCFEFRLKKTAEFMDRFDRLATTLTVSRYKDSTLINDIGDKVSPKYLDADLKADRGYQLSIDLSKEYGLYRQKYCGCQYSRE